MKNRLFSLLVCGLPLTFASAWAKSPKPSTHLPWYTGPVIIIVVAIAYFWVLRNYFKDCPPPDKS